MNDFMKVGDAAMQQVAIKKVLEEQKRVKDLQDTTISIRERQAIALESIATSLDTIAKFVLQAQKDTDREYPSE